MIQLQKNLQDLSKKNYNKSQSVTSRSWRGAQCSTAATSCRSSELTKGIIMARMMLQPEILLGGIVTCAGFQYFLAIKPLIASILSIVISVLFRLALGKRQQLKLPPGPRGVPILGYLPFLTNLPHRKMAELAQQYGPLVYIQLGSMPTLLVSSPQMLKEVLVTQDHIFGSRLQTSTANRHFGKGHTGLATAPLGPVHKDLRRVYTQKLISPQTVEAFQPIRTDEMKAMVRGLWEDSQGGNTVNLHQAVVTVATNITSRMVLKKRYLGKNVDDHEEARIFLEFSDMIPNTFGDFYLADFIPSVHPITSLFNNEKKIASVGTRADAFVETLIEKHLRQLNTASPEMDEQASLLDVMLKLVKEGQYKMDKQSLKILLLELLLIGTEAIWVGAEWAMAELLRRPNMMRRLQMELDDVVGTSRMVEESDIPNLPFVQAIIRETFRLHPSGPFLLPHDSTQATKIAGYDIPAYTRVFPNVWAMGRDPSVWDRPTEFDPTRFLNLTAEEMQEPRVKFTPFGAGRRGCPGQRPGVMILGLALAHLVHSFNWSPDVEFDMSESFSRAAFVVMKEPLTRINIQAPRFPISFYTDLPPLFQNAK